MRIFILDLPAPLHGMSNINKCVLEEAERLGVVDAVINTSPSYAARWFGTPLWLLFRTIHAVKCLCQLAYFLAMSSGSVVYRPINGGVGQIYDIFYIVICRLFKAKVYIHHHSFKYINNRSRIFAFFLRVAGSRVTHIVLGSSMGVGLRSLYGLPERAIKKLSNIAFFDFSHSKREFEKEGSFKIGYLSNICFEKGIREFCELCKLMEESGIEYTAEVAGPFVNKESEELVVAFCNDNPRVSYLGPLYKKEKELFFSGLDCFFFPSMYENEAEPVVLYEAAFSGVYLMGSKRGCMNEVINGLRGTALSDEKISSLAFTDLKELIDRNEFSVESRRCRMMLFKEKSEAEKKQLIMLLELMGRDRNATGS